MQWYVNVVSRLASLPSSLLQLAPSCLCSVLLIYHSLNCLLEQLKECFPKAKFSKFPIQLFSHLVKGSKLVRRVCCCCGAFVASAMRCLPRASTSLPPQQEKRIKKINDCLASYVKHAPKAAPFRDFITPRVSPAATCFTQYWFGDTFLTFSYTLARAALPVPSAPRERAPGPQPRRPR